MELSPEDRGLVVIMHELRLVFGMGIWQWEREFELELARCGWEMKGSWRDVDGRWRGVGEMGMGDGLNLELSWCR